MRRRLTHWFVAIALSVLALPAAAHAQQSDAERLEQNQATATAIIARDSVFGHFRDASTPTSVVIVQPESRLACVGSSETLRLAYLPPQPNIVNYRCISTVSDPSVGAFDIDLRTIGLTPPARQLMAQIGAGDLIDQTTPSLAEMWAEQIHARPWEGFRAEVGGGTSPPHPPFEIVRSQGVRDGREVYLRVAWARVGDWMFLQRVEAPLESQVAAEGLASLQFYNALLAASH